MRLSGISGIEFHRRAISMTDFSLLNIGFFRIMRVLLRQISALTCANLTFPAKS
jgi:hypothetical protein